MDINFHYYAVKTLAIHAGFDEECAQIIARYSQFVDVQSAKRNVSPFQNEPSIFLKRNVPLGYSPTPKFFDRLTPVFT